MTATKSEPVKYTLDIPQNIGQSPQARQFLGAALESLLILLEKRGQSVEPLMKETITPERLEQLLTLKSKNAQAQGLLEAVARTGGISQGTAQLIRESQKEFREDFEFRHDNA